MNMYNFSLMDNNTVSNNISVNGDFGNFSNLSTIWIDDFQQEEYIFDRTDVRVIFILLYSIVFCCCFFGNLLVILVVTLSRRLRSITNFFLANLAVADLCVGIFCVFQNLTMYLIPTWVLGNFLCKMYQFVHSLSYTASIFILVVICTERYFAIIHPITCKQILTPTRLRFVILAVWVISALYSAPRFVWVETIENKMRNGEVETICTNHRKKYNSELFDMINFVFLYVIPLAIMTVLYTRIAVGLWRSSKQLERHLNASESSQTLNNVNQCNLTAAYTPASHLCNQTHRFKHQPLNSKASSDGKAPIMSMPNPNSSQNVLKARRGVIRMLIIVVLTFAICNLPFHARKMWQYWSTGYRGSSNFSTLFTPLTFLITYFNSGVNPLLYAFLSRNFRRGMREILMCSMRKHGTRRAQSQLTTQNPRGIQRGMSTRSTIKQNTTTVTILNNSGDYSQDV